MHHLNPEIRPFEPGDYPAFVELLNALRPEHRLSEHELREDDEALPVGHVLERWLAEQDGRLAGSGAFGHNEDAFHPQRFWLRVGVRPSCIGRGVGSRLYQRLMSRLESRDVISVTTKARVDERVKIRFFERRGFVEVMREFESRLDVAACDLAPYDGLVPALQAQGIEVRTLAQLARDPRYRQKIYQLHTALDADVPAVAPYTPPSYATFARHHFDSPRLIRESFFVAVLCDEFIGMSELWRSQADPYLHTGLTGVLPAFRRRGVALAMKVAGIRFAREHGYPEIRTEN
ncbi:MAG TPA: GNAT family N-acetyltransferase, partial [Trueperaceae bacterium]